MKTVSTMIMSCFCVSTDVDDEDTESINELYDKIYENQSCQALDGGEWTLRERWIYKSIVNGSVKILKRELAARISA